MLTGLLNNLGNNMGNTQNTEQRIMEAAEKLFLKKGYILSTTTLIAKEAGVTHAMLHYYLGQRSRYSLKFLIRIWEN